ncbi:MAG: hypothetical protein O7H41_21300 [Planctomycetota bacterium]|nr:hypothetical protein [Planctomycetota bacterium]
MKARWWSGLVVAAAALSACTSPACRDENLPEYKDRATPERGMQFFQYAIANECDPHAWDCFNERSQKQFGYLGFKFGFCTIEFPGTDICICELIKKAEIAGIRPADGRGMAVKAVSHDVFLMTVLWEEDGQWKIDLEATMKENGFERKPE